MDDIPARDEVCDRIFVALKAAVNAESQRGGWTMRELMVAVSATIAVTYEKLGIPPMATSDAICALYAMGAAVALSLLDTRHTRGTAEVDRKFEKLMRTFEQN